MNITEKKKNKRIVRDMKECFRSFHLPVNDIKSPHGDEMNVVFGSQLCNDHVCAGVVVTHDRPEGYVGMEAAFHFKVPSERMAEVMQLLNLLNGISSLFVYSICQCCNGVSMNASLFLPDGSLPKEKFKRLIHEMLEDAYFCLPFTRRNYRGWQRRKPSMTASSTMTGGLWKARSHRRPEVRSWQTWNRSCSGSRCTLVMKSRLIMVLYMDCGLSDRDFPLRMGMTSWQDGKTVTMQLVPPFVVPNEKIPAMTELVNWMNKVGEPDN